MGRQVFLGMVGNCSTTPPPEPCVVGENFWSPAVADEDWTVPEGVTTIFVTLVGGRGVIRIGGSLTTAGRGAVFQGYLNVVPGDIVNIVTGASGRGNEGLGFGNGAGGAPDGGNSGMFGLSSLNQPHYGGGGSSRLRINGNLVLVCGGGGGGYKQVGSFTVPTLYVYGDAGIPTTGVTADSISDGLGGLSATGGGGGSQVAGGAAGSPAGTLVTAQAGASFQGGHGGANNLDVVGAGGGGGYFGGGGGGARVSGSAGVGAGGGGGSSFLDESYVCAGSEVSWGHNIILVGGVIQY